MVWIREVDGPSSSKCAISAEFVAWPLLIKLTLVSTSIERYDWYGSIQASVYKLNRTSSEGENELKEDYGFTSHRRYLVAKPLGLILPYFSIKGTSFIFIMNTDKIITKIFFIYYNYFSNSLFFNFFNNLTGLLIFVLHLHSILFMLFNRFFQY